MIIEMNDVSSFFFYMWNAWNEQECEKVFKTASCGWKHFWDKWCGICNAHGVWGAAERLYAELSETNRDLLVKRACLVYNRSHRREGELKNIRDLKEGDYFRLRVDGKVYVRGEYDRSTKRYSYYDFDDMCNEHFAKATRKVITDFEF